MDFHQTKNNVIYKIISLQITNDGVGVLSCVVLSVPCFYCLCVRFPSFAAGRGYPLEGGGAHFVASPLRQWFFVDGVLSVAFDAQCSPGPANSL